MEINEKQGSSGVAKAGLTTGIIGTSLGALAGLGELAGGAVAWCVYAIRRLDALLPAWAAKAGLDKLGAIDGDGNVDLDGLLEAVRPQIGPEGMGIEVPVLGSITLYPADLDTLARYIKEA